MTEVQVADGNGIDQFRLDQLQARFISIVRNTTRRNSQSQLVAVITELLAAGRAKRNEKDDIIVPIDTGTMTFNSTMFGPPPGSWNEGLPEHFGYYWIMYRGYKEPFVVEYDNKRCMTRTSDGMKITRAHISYWKRTLGR
jgi:hypothetical protein